MEQNQKINCTVTSCKYNNQEKEKCTLEAIKVAPIENTITKQPDESMCASYEYEKEWDSRDSPKLSHFILNYFI